MKKNNNCGVVKFGGTSLADGRCFDLVATIIMERPFQQVCAVLSAPAKVTNLLVALAELNVSHDDTTSQESDAIFLQLDSIFTTIFEQLTTLYPLFSRELLEKEWRSHKQQLMAYHEGIKLLQVCPDKIYAQIISLGERMSILIMQHLLEARGKSALIIDPVSYLRGSDDYLASVVDIEQSRHYFTTHPIPKDLIGLMAGFTAGNDRGELVTLGRNGSDYSAALLAASMDANCCEIWTDVDGVYTCDPRLVNSAYLLKRLSYQEAMELSYFGAKVLHPKTIAPIAQFQIPCFIKNTHNPEGAGTLISELSDDSSPIKGLSVLSNLVMVNVSGAGMKGMVGMASRVFNAISSANASVVLITQSSSEYNISLCITMEDFDCVKQELESRFELELKDGMLDPIDYQTNVSVITLVGDGIRDHSGLAARFFTSLAYMKINVTAIAASERAISAVIPKENETQALRACHATLFQKGQFLDIFVIGVGGVGAVLLDQIQRQREMLKRKGIELRVIGIANTRGVAFNGNGLPLENWRDHLKSNELILDATFKDLAEYVERNHILNPVIVDCTASQTIADQYVDFLKAGFHVVTPNKKANTSSLEYYQLLQKTVLEAKRKFMYETTVGAGLPVIENLQNLLAAGDSLRRFNGILSGSLSFIFGKLDEGLSFSEATHIASQHGFTEPDPRDDLSGLDVARKVLILAREAGSPLELSDIIIEGALPAEFDSSGDIDTFMKNLSQVDDYFTQKANEAKNRGEVLRYVAQIDDDGKCHVGIQSVDAENPMYKIKDGENALAFYSDYYQPIPLVLRGYGAGNEVTAAGIFSDLMRLIGWKKEI